MSAVIESAFYKITKNDRGKLIFMIDLKQRSNSASWNIFLECISASQIRGNSHYLNIFLDCISAKSSEQGIGL
jgi:hypothetical protein